MLTVQISKLNEDEDNTTVQFYSCDSAEYTTYEGEAAVGFIKLCYPNVEIDNKTPVIALGIDGEYCCLIAPCSVNIINEGGKIIDSVTIY